MIVSLSSAIFSPQQQLIVVPTSPLPIFSCGLNYKTKNGFLNSTTDHFSAIRFSNEFSSRRAASSVANYEAMLDDLNDDVSDESDYEDDDEEDEEESDSDYESDWESKGESKALSTTSRVDDALSLQKFEEDLVREVERMLEPEERAILERNEAPNLEKLTTEKWKPLHTFALAGQIKFMDAMLDKGYDINLVDKDGLTALHIAVIGKREAVISHLLRKGANPEVKDQDGATPLHYAAQVGAMQSVKLLIKYKVDVNVADNEGWTPLHVAMQTRNRDIVKILVVNGADRTRANKDGKTAVDLSMCYGKEFKSYDLAKLLKQVPSTRGF
ncbi:hypothetical protein ABFS83_11G121600 [Erythranthe nasuta]